MIKLLLFVKLINTIKLSLFSLTNLIKLIPFILLDTISISILFIIYRITLLLLTISLDTIGEVNFLIVTILGLI